MGEFYEAKDFEGRSSNWAKHAKFLKEHFGFVKPYWEYDEEKWRWDLEPNEAVLLERSVNALSNNCTGPIRKVIKGAPRLGQFQHICLWLPINHGFGEHRFLYDYDTVHTFKDVIVDMVPGLFPGYQLGYYFRVAYQACYGDYPEIHIHIALSRIRYRQEDHGELREFILHDWKSRPSRSLYFNIDPITLSNEEMAGLVEPVWRDAIKKVTGYEVRSDMPMVSVTGRDGQTILDRYDVIHYIANQHLHTFNNVKSLSLAKDKKIIMEFRRSNRSNPAILALTQRSFARTYLIKPMQTFGIQFRGRGFLCGCAAFARVGNDASRLVLDKPREKGEPRTFFYDLPVESIRKRSVKVRRCLEAGDMKGFKHIKAKYKLGDPMRELQILKDLRRKKRLEDFNLRMELKKQKEYAAAREHDDDLMALD
jgi:hypothetical protein